jgi:hypothetical protein
VGAFGTSHSLVLGDHIDFLHPTYLIQPLIDVDPACLVDLVLEGRRDMVKRWIAVGIVEKRAPLDSATNGINQEVRRLGSNLLLGLLLLKNGYFLVDSRWVVVDYRYFEDANRM